MKSVYLISARKCMIIIFFTALYGFVSSQTYVQNQFVISSFQALGSDSTTYSNLLLINKEAGIDMIETAFMPSVNVDAALRNADSIGIKVLAQDLNYISGFQNSLIPVFTQTSVTNRINSLKNHSSLYGYYIWDEPFLENLSTAKTLKDYVQISDPNKLALTVMLPSYGNYTWAANTYSGYVDSYCTTINPDVLSFDYYPYNNNTVSIIKNDLWRDFGYIRKKSIALNKPLWFYFQAKSVNPGDVVMNIERIKAQMFAALAYGVKGLSYYTTSPEGALLDANLNKTLMYDGIKALNSQVKYIGNLIFNKTSQFLYHTTLPTNGVVLYNLDNLSTSTLIKSAPANLVIGVFGDSVTAKKYLIVSNLSHTSSVIGNITLKSPMNVALFDKTDNTEKSISTSSSTLSVNLTPGEAKVYIVSTSNIFHNILGNYEVLNHYAPSQWGWDYVGAGWAFDKEAISETPVSVRIFVDGVFYKDVLANEHRPDLIGFNGITTANHGFSFGINRLNPLLSHTVEVKIIKSNGGSLVSLGSKQIPATAFGNFEVLNYYNPVAYGWSFIGEGWAADKDIANEGSVTCRIFVDGIFCKDVIANANRPDIVGFNGLMNPAHGFEFGIAGIDTTAQHIIDVRLIKQNALGGTDYFSLGSKTTIAKPLKVTSITSSNLENTDESILRIYPNPSNGIVNIQTSLGKISNTIVYDLQGRIVFHSNSGQHLLNLTALEKGTYIVELCFDNRNFKQMISLK